MGAQDRAKMLQKGRYCVQAAVSAADFAASHHLRGRCFGPAGAARDAFDMRCQHFLVFDTADTNNLAPRLVCSFRILLLEPKNISQSYSAQFYDLEALQRFEGKILELGRFCVDPDVQDPDVLRLAWGALTAYVDEHDVRLLFGCSSFEGTDPTPYLDTFAMLKSRHLAPSQWPITRKAQQVFEYAEAIQPDLNAKQALARTPPLLRTYLTMGGWVSDHAVIDSAMNTLHVFTGLEIAAIPPARKRLLRAVVQE